ncbi:MAG: aminotransferase class III-fold pyridoxal phosphate-dependent enzyme [Candidatus Thioglobus sp.]|jgi:taurine-pyruvate aminotransferase|nr:aminotransferase class III-fold pyridoxal phosphate-dependent enzyme [Candidatus Pseudothioglobus aerophilus]MBT3439526.1 aminotransferase class III-fold pyridoxal phosphate-dependent enzyme [Gammaproteobacteria bacterium]MBT3952523.1 aminotransferase class III-fold pyridoxal phosphate-dependent enzyme [Rhodobacterales bacterium]MBT4586569.1 aminotransferase class III-fold pyridoxal phosphate-dependent enzyme [Gammaproteobacteria bacterium]MBT5548778.1 aminotransferase class III-fold pyridox
MSNNTLIQNDKDHVWHHLTQHKGFESTDPMMVANAKGMVVTDTNGNEYLDGTSGGVWTVNLGFGRDDMVQAVSNQLTKIPYFAGSFGNEPAAEYAKEVTSLMPGLDRVYYSNSGSEANEKGYKMVRQLAHFKNDGKKHKIIYRDRDYHGTTIGAMSSSGQIQRKKQYGPFAPGFVEMPHCCCYRCPFGKKYGECNIECATVLEDIIKKEGPDTVGSVVLEPITAGGGVIPPVPEYFPIIESICRKYDVLLHIDEVVCGLGRTGKWFGYQHYDVQPDIVTTAKGLAAGYAAVSITVTTEKLFNMFKEDPTNVDSYFRDISTFGGSTAGPAAAIEVLKIIKREKLLENVNEVGEHLKNKLLELQDKHEMIGEVRGKGLFCGVELVKDRATKEPVDETVAAGVAAHCFKNKVMIGRTNRSFETNNNVLLFSPAFICTKTDIDLIVESVDNALEANK